MTEEELKKYDGKEGRKAYVAFKGKVYDVTSSSFWKKGEHEGLHVAGRDLSAQIAGAPHGDEVFKNFKVVGSLDKGSDIKNQEEMNQSSSVELKKKLQEWYVKYHPHPATVHFPIALHFFAGALDLLFLSTKNSSYETAVFYSFFIATLMGLVAMVPGILSWWVNYGFSKARPFVIKLYVSIATLIIGIIGIALRTQNPDVAYGGGLDSFIYHLSVLITVPAVAILAYYGGKITWPEGAKPKVSSKDDKKHPKEDNQDIQKQTSTLSNPKLIESISQNTHKEGLFYPKSLPKSLQESSFEKKEAIGVDFGILIGGPAGAGIKTVEDLLYEGFRNLGLNVFATIEYMSRVRGGSNSTYIRFSNSQIKAPKYKADLILGLNEAGLLHLQSRAKENTIIIVDASKEGADEEILKRARVLEAQKIAEDIGDKRYANTVFAGSVFGVLNLPLEPLEQVVSKKFYGKNEEENLKALKEGYERASAFAQEGIKERFSFSKRAQKPVMSGTEACGFGVMAAGCDLVCSYPMSPSTGLLEFMASMSKTHTILVEQAEDEIAAINMIIGAWYAGARAIATTSGGGFALMCEGISLSGMSEVPSVIYLAMRPGPATGLPTRTEQGDLELAIYAGHGEFPKVILAPGDLNECLELSYLAMNLADFHQIPAVILIDQYLAESRMSMEGVNLDEFLEIKHITKSTKEYQRYALTKSGISPRAIPAWGEGLVVSGSDEHDERGQITESMKMRDSMVDKRKRKEAGLKEVALPPKVYGKGEIAVVGFGSTKEVISEVLGMLDDPRLYQIHYFFVYPLNEEALEPLKKAKKIVMVENNTNGQFARLLQREGVSVDELILKGDGMPFFVDELSEKLKGVIQ
ncbi:MAG: 2-oxoacid:acceptor oxidoreductase subunit alpha [Campylobacterales bacterium]